MGDGCYCHYCRRYRCLCETGWRVLVRLEGRAVQTLYFGEEAEARDYFDMSISKLRFYTLELLPPRDPELREVLRPVEGGLKDARQDHS